MWVLGVVSMLIFNIVLMLILTMVIAAITLLESKLLALVQSSVGPNFVGYKGSLQYLADALKLFVKGVSIPTESNYFWFLGAPSLVSCVCYSFWINSVWGPSMSIFDVEYNIVYASILSVLFGLCIILSGYFSRNKYSMLASVSCAVLMLNLEIFLGLLFLNVALFGESFSFTSVVVYQEVLWLILAFLSLSASILLVFLLEVNSAPFDLAEAESELVTGYSTEYGGFFFALFYLGEYFHLFFFSLIVSIFFFGGWETPTLLFFFLEKYCHLPIV